MAQPISQQTAIAEAQDGALLSAVDLIVVLPNGGSDALLTNIHKSVGASAGRLLLFHPQPGPSAGIYGSQFQVMPLPEQAEASAKLAPGQSTQGLLPFLFEQMRRQAAPACVVLSSSCNEEIDCAAAIRELAGPVREENYDLALANYAEGRFAGLINRSLIYPLTRALYGLRIHYPLAPDFAFSSRLTESYGGDANPPSLTAAPAPNLTTRALHAGLRICQVNTDAARDAPKEQSDLSTALAGILNPLFVEMESNAALWQRPRGSQLVRTFGELAPRVDYGTAGRAEFDISRMVDAFARGYRDLFEVWAEVLSPRTLLDLKKLARLPLDAFQMADETWVRLVYEFALGHRQRVMNRDHLLRSLTPLYLAWVASHALQAGAATEKEVENRQERLCLTFEASKPYLLSRWRWPDRFNP